MFTSVPDFKRNLMRDIRHDNKSSRTVKWKYADPFRPINTQSVGTGHQAACLLASIQWRYQFALLKRAAEMLRALPSAISSGCTT